MKTATTIALAVLRIAGTIQIVLGLLFWTGNALSLIPIHMNNGYVVVISLWALALLAGIAGVSPGLVALAAVWGIIVPLLGLNQARLLPGDFHWIIQVLHLLVGLAAIGLGEDLAGRIRNRAVQGSPASA